MVSSSSGYWEEGIAGSTLLVIMVTVMITKIELGTGLWVLMVV